MKKLILMGALILLSAQFSCRTVLRQKKQSDSTAVRSEASSEKWAREVIREYLPGRVDTVHSIDSQIIQVPKLVTVQQPVLIRESIRENAEKQQTKQEEKTVVTEQATLTKEGRSPWIYLACGAGAMFLLMSMMLIGYKVIKARIIASLKMAS